MKKRNRRILIISTVILISTVSLYSFWLSKKDQILLVYGVTFTTPQWGPNHSFFLPKSVAVVNGDEKCFDGEFKCSGVTTFPSDGITIHSGYTKCDSSENCPGEQWCLLGPDGQVIDKICHMPSNSNTVGGICTVVICDIINGDLPNRILANPHQIQPDVLKDLKHEVEQRLPDHIKFFSPNPSHEKLKSLRKPS